MVGTAGPSIALTRAGRDRRLRVLSRFSSPCAKNSALLRLSKWRRDYHATVHTVSLGIGSVRFHSRSRPAARARFRAAGWFLRTDHAALSIRIATGSLRSDGWPSPFGAEPAGPRPDLHRSAGPNR